MILVGIVGNKKTIKGMKQIIENKIKSINIIEITEKSLDNIKNIKFDIVIIQNKIEEPQKEKILKLCKKAKYVIINTDMNKQYIGRKSRRIITCGSSGKADVTISSNTEDDILIYWQKHIEDISGKTIEIEERRIKKQESNNLEIDEILIIYTILTLYSNTIIDKI